MTQDNHQIPDCIPESLVSKAVPLNSPATGEVAWSSVDVFSVIDLLSKNNFVILGGDVMSKENDKLVYTYCNWNTEREGAEWGEFVLKAKEKTILYITNLKQNNPESEYYFVLTWDNKIA